MRTDEEYEADAAVWENAYDRVCDILERFGVEGLHDDYWVHDDYWGTPQVKIYALNLKMVMPPIVQALQEMIAEFPPGYEIVVAIAVPEHRTNWPDMGLRIRAHEIVDGLQRSYFPPEYRDIAYPTARPWVAADD